MISGFVENGLENGRDVGFLFWQVPVGSPLPQQDTSIIARHFCNRFVVLPFCAILCQAEVVI